jgi:predicted phage terminase large subunit-like protein
VAQDVKVTPQDTMRVYGRGAPKVILMDAWADHLDFRALLLKVAQTCHRWKIDKLVIENKAAGHSIGQEIRRLMTEGTIQDPQMVDLFRRTYAVQLVDPKAIDKIARLYSVQHIFEDQMVFAPERPWSDLVIDQCAVFPNGKHDDLVDTVSQGLRHLRDIGMLERGMEITAQLNSELRYKSRPPGKLYPG